jgi:hypothetical protein
MCLVLYLGSDKYLPLIEPPGYSDWRDRSPEWLRVAQRFCVWQLSDNERPAREVLSTVNLVGAGSYEGCGCGFNYGREYPDDQVDPDHLLAAKESVAALVDYIRANNVTQVYACWDGSGPRYNKQSERVVSVEELQSPAFVFKENELIHLKDLP